MINIADSRFQEDLLTAAKRANKIDSGYRIPEQYRHNTRERLEESFEAQRRAGLFSEYPFGTDLTREEIDLARALRWLKEHTANRAGRALTIVRAILSGDANETDRVYLERLALSEPADFRERLTAKLVRLGLRATARERSAATSRTAAKDP
jgi:hypothetical protein